MHFVNLCVVKVLILFKVLEFSLITFVHGRLVLLLLSVIFPLVLDVHFTNLLIWTISLLLNLPLGDKR